jgi:hypothetical protein
MYKFVQVDTAPTELRKGEFVITKPDFLEEIKANATKASRPQTIGPGKTSLLTGPNQLRYIVDSIGMRYDNEGTNGWSIKPHQFEGRPYTNDLELSAIVVEMLEKSHPSIFKKYVESHLATLPTGTELVYLVNFAGVPEAVSALTNRGFTEVTTDDISTL